MLTSTTGEGYPLTPIQQGMLLHQLAAAGSGFDIEQMAMMLREELDPRAFRQAWERLIARHDVFRTRFEWEAREQPLQVVQENVELPWAERDWSGLSAGDQETRLAEYLREDRQRGFDPQVAPLVRCALFRCGETEWRFVWTFHHMLADGASYPALIEEAFATYQAIREGRELGLPSPKPFREFIEWQQSHQRNTTEAAEVYWRDSLKGFSAATPLPETGAGTCADYGELSASVAVAAPEGIALTTLVQAAWALVLGRNAGEEDVVIGVTRACRKATIPEAEKVVGLFINTLPVRVKLSREASVEEWLRELNQERRAMREFEHTPLVDVQRFSEVPAGSGLFHNLVVFTPRLVGATMREYGAAWANREIQFHERTNFPLTLFAYGEAELLLKISYDRARFTDSTVARLLDELKTVLKALATPAGLVADVPVLSGSERQRVLVTWNDTRREYATDRMIHELIEDQAVRTPKAVALVFRGDSMTYGELNRRANQLAKLLRDLGAGPEKLVGVYTGRSIDMMVGLLAVLKSGAAYVPLDPEYPKERIAWVLEDTRASIILTDSTLLGSLPIHPCEIICLDSPGLWDSTQTLPNVWNGSMPSNLAYVLFTSGSSGRPKGVMIEHRNVLNFFAGMDESLDRRKGGTWLAVTSISFDISVLELFWTLSRGFKVVIDSAEQRASARNRPACDVKRTAPLSTRKMDFSLFYFSANAGGEGGRDRYRLLLEGAKYADAHGFSAIWTPERHFHEFGGLYPNPALTSAAIAAVTSRIQIRAGSVVLPLHDPIRVAEEWAVVDNLSGGRVGLSFASGWHVNDFVLKPENWRDRKQLMFDGIETVKRLWRGESVTRRNGAGEEIQVRILPTPVQSNPKVWVTAATSVETFRSAGELGANLLTNLLGQKVEDLGKKIAAYRQAWREHGHSGEGHVTLMLHTFVGADREQVRAKVRKPFTDYLKTSTELVKQARWEFPAFAAKNGLTATESDALSADDLDALMNHAFDRYFETSGLFGSPEDCLEMTERLKSAGVDEIACLIDFGVETGAVLKSLEFLNIVRERANPSAVAAADDYSIAAQMRRHKATHLQCTPSMARMLLADAASVAALKPLEKMLVGGEALPPGLATELTSTIGGELLNMYGPTETTVWSTYTRVADSDVTIGRPLANTQIYIVDRDLRPVPTGASGELLIGGDGVGRGYLNRADLTAEKFVVNPFGDGKLYRTGDLARYREDGNIEFLRRMDSQVKIRGHRIELGDIEAALEEHSGVWECAVTAREDASGEKQLVAYVVPQPTSSGAKETAAELVARWGALWDETYRNGRVDAAWNTSGWNSSYTGEPLPEEDMREWVEATVGRIEALKPRRVLEIGCGTGLLLFRLAPQCESYVGVDLSAAALEAIGREARARGLHNVHLRQSAAAELTDLKPESFDVVVINSVVQYFPDVEYLVRVMETAAKAVRPGGALFVGDVRNHALLEAFHTSVEMERAPESSSAEEVKRRIEQRIAGESELLVAPEFFEALRGEIANIGDVTIQLKRGHRHNEMTRFRYDVVMKIGEPVTSLTETDVTASSVVEIRQRLDGKPAAIAVRGLRNPRLAREVRAMELLRAEGGPATAADLRKAADVAEGIEPEALWSLDASYEVDLQWSGAGFDRYDAIFVRRGTPRLIQTEAMEPVARKPWSEFANRRQTKPAPGALIQELKIHFKERRPAYMAPAAYVMLDALPRTPNGKIDWKALPAPEAAKREVAPAALPRTEMERQIAGVWKRLLNLETVGRTDNFFDLGANSLTMVQANSRLREELQCTLSLVDLFRYPSVGALAEHLNDSGAEEEVLENSQARGRTRLDAMLRRMHARQVASEELGA
ncbi:MAG TPA: MupA/Atu3671 family FMN-dependent luciferase-like monooxygenase [Bryobacteraceae bacterium]|jgi:natural product biosynthesis luciferase-like monooxygenase protein